MFKNYNANKNISFCFYDLMICLRSCLEEKHNAKMIFVRSVFEFLSSYFPNCCIPNDFRYRLLQKCSYVEHGQVPEAAFHCWLPCATWGSSQAQPTRLQQKLNVLVRPQNIHAGMNWQHMTPVDFCPNINKNAYLSTVSSFWMSIV